MNGPARFLGNLSATTWERARISNAMIQFMVIENLATFIFGRVFGSQRVMENGWDLKIPRRDEDNLVGRRNY